MKQFYVCSCFFTRNIFVSKYDIHFNFHNRQQFLKEYGTILKQKGCDTDAKVNQLITEIQEEIERRKSLGQQTLKRSEEIQQKYTPLKPHVYNLQENFLAPAFLRLVEHCKLPEATKDSVVQKLGMETADRVYSFPVFTPQFCEDFIEEMINFENSDMPKGRPNTMNKYGTLLNELGFDEGLITPLREDYLRPITSLLYPDWGGDSLDSHKAFVVTYKLDQDLSLSYHYDNAEVTLNISLGRDFDEGSLFFGKMKGSPQPHDMGQCAEYKHKPTHGLIHRGQHMHGALPIQDGERYNLIIWMRSSKVRNQKCPMCDEKPHLVPTVGGGDGFTKEKKNVNVCAAS
ncbi:2-oxoglutarate and iron-dependent oxygenase domain-containing protein 2 [Lingula anatina]|uniref:2-oxoglutarate and iron-dependent oxygenase domain-containing protein 2 n=1 Tax=Lingula anatina TaxID=7574 RepID=A0A1S3JJV1_LINAN|nr:2-oxoglutarate and iron-dependent oxygenase domain-containing protein 2 [Lingula anatina]|eukprot:XP_013410690.1 2-oxoglutarate and iron-dependent oxygenase domain-containing protein 2 [Lingula anatina]